MVGTMVVFGELLLPPFKRQNLIDIETRCDVNDKHIFVFEVFELNT